MHAGGELRGGGSLTDAAVAGVVERGDDLVELLPDVVDLLRIAEHRVDLLDLSAGRGDGLLDLRAPLRLPVLAAQDQQRAAAHGKCGDSIGSAHWFLSQSGTPKCSGP